MKILVIGSGGREHALCLAFYKSAVVTQIFCAPGNAGIAQIAECVNIKPEEIENLIAFAKSNQIDLTFVGGETALALGIADEFEKQGLQIIGASRNAARLEASKSFAKDFMQRHNVPTAKFETADSPREAIEILQNGKFGDENTPVVVKADGLAAGKGVVVAANRQIAENAVREMETLAGEKAAAKIVLEECLVGREVSLLMFADGENFKLMPPVRDHKRIYENDRGANTGGMGTVCDDSLLSETDIAEIVQDIIEPTLQGCRAEGFPFRGILFLGLMMTASGVKVLEYNVRFGDPETQSILVRLNTNFVEVCEAITNGTLAQTDIKWQKGSSACVVLAAENYPNQPRTGDIIYGLENNFESVTVFHAGTKKDVDGNFITAGGRVLGITAVDDNLAEALEKSYRAVNAISWNGMQYRRDIGK